MRLTICHLSDIHFDTSNNIILERQKKLCDAILQNALKGDIIMFLVTGDVAQSGMKEEYEIATNFFVDIEKYLEKEKNLTVLYFFVPGNHDCDFSDQELLLNDKLKKEQVIYARQDISEEQWPIYIEGLSKKQTNYFDFVSIFDYDDKKKISIKCIKRSKLLTQYQIKIDEKRVRLNLLNSAWLSEIEEKPGTIYIPEMIYQDIRKEGELVISAYHHPSNWMHPDDKNEFNRWVFNKSDLVFVGHEHFGENELVETRDTTYCVQYGEVLQERKEFQKSGFIITYIDDDKKRVDVYGWNNEKNLYEVKHSDETILYVRDNKFLSFQSEYYDYLQAAEMRMTHPNKGKVTLRDVYVYPDIEMYESDDAGFGFNSESVTIKGEDLLSFILDKKKVSFSGGAKVGKTSLAKNTVLDLAERGKYSIIIDCNVISAISNDALNKIEKKCISEAYGKEYVDTFKQLALSNKVIILDNFGKIRDRDARKKVLDYYDNFYDYIITLSNVSFEMELLDESLNKEASDFIYCTINELGYKKRNQLLKKWYNLKDGGGAISESIVDEKVNNAMSVINVLKGNGYMPCIPSHILIILQQLESSLGGSNEERSNYGYLYEFLINKSVLEMTQNCEYVNKDIVFGILTNVAAYMLQSAERKISIDKFRNIVMEYNTDYQTDANSDQYLNECIKVELLALKNDEVYFCYQYIYYYFIAKFLANNVTQEWAKDLIQDISQHLYDEESGDIMIFLCHISKDDYIISTVLNTAKTILSDKETFDFEKHKAIKLTFDEYIKVDFIPEEGTKARQEALLESRDIQEKENKLKGETGNSRAENEYLCHLDNAIKTIEVMGQILKNYPGTIKGSVKNELLDEIYILGMKTLTYTKGIMYDGIENMFNDIRRDLQPEISSVEWAKIEEMSRALNASMDNLFGIFAYAVIRKLAACIANKALMPVITQSKLNEEVGYALISDSIKLNEFGTISVDQMISKFEKYNKEGNSFAAKLHRLLVLDHYYVYGSADYKGRQRIWDKMQFGQKEKLTMLQGEKK